MKNLEKMICVAFIALSTGMAIESVGHVPKDANSPITWGAVAGAFMAMTVPAMLGYIAGRKDGKRED